MDVQELLRKKVGRDRQHPFVGAVTHQPCDCAYVDPPAARQLRKLSPNGGLVPNLHHLKGVHRAVQPPSFR